MEHFLAGARVQVTIQLSLVAMTLNEKYEGHYSIDSMLEATQ
jgi:hypothetical protein